MTKAELNRRIKFLRLITKVMTTDVATNDYADILEKIELAELVLHTLKINVNEKIRETDKTAQVA